MRYLSRRSSNSKITVKCRLGTNKLNGWDHLQRFIEACKAGGTTEVIVHARICILSGLSPAQNRTIPPLDYDMVHGLVQEFPDMKFGLNGGIRTFEEADAHLGRGQVGDCADSRSSYHAAVDSVMMGREAYNNPWVLARADSHFFSKRNLCFDR